MSKNPAPESAKQLPLKGDQAMNLYFALRQYANSNSLIALAPVTLGSPHEIGVQFRTLEEAAFFQEEFGERGIHFHFVNVRGIREPVVAIGSPYVAVNKTGENSFHLIIGHGGYDPDDGHALRRHYTQDIHIKGQAWQRIVERVLPANPRVHPPESIARRVRPDVRRKRVAFPQPPQK